MEEGKKSTDKKKVIIGISVVIVAVCILGAIGWDRVFAFLFLVSLGILIYRAVKKKPKKHAVAAVIVFFVLTGIANIFSGNRGNSSLLVGTWALEKYYMDGETYNYTGADTVWITFKKDGTYKENIDGKTIEGVWKEMPDWEKADQRGEYAYIAYISKDKQYEEVQVIGVFKEEPDVFMRSITRETEGFYRKQ